MLVSRMHFLPHTKQSRTNQTSELKMSLCVFCSSNSFQVGLTFCRFEIGWFMGFPDCNSVEIGPNFKCCRFWSVFTRPVVLLRHLFRQTLLEYVLIISPFWDIGQPLLESVSIIARWTNCYLGFPLWIIISR